MLNRNTAAIGLLAAGTLVFETTLTRFLGVAQFYHFAFLVVSLALLGLGASGTILTVYPRLKSFELSRVLLWVGPGFAISVGCAYAGVNYIPFDSFSIAWERIQILYFALYYFVLALPFIIGGLGIGIALSLEDEDHYHIYGANLAGSAAGALLTPVTQQLSGVPGAVLFSALVGLCIVFIVEGKKPRILQGFSAVLLGAGLTVFVVFTAWNMSGNSSLGMRISPYKGLSQARRYPDSTSRFGAWNAVSRVDVFARAGTRKLPGLSYQFQENPPDQLGMSVDAGPLQPITLTSPSSFKAARWMPEWVAFSLHSDSHVLVLNPQGGLGVLQALSSGANKVTAVVGNPLLLKAVRETSGNYDVYQHPKVEVKVKNDRAFVRRMEKNFDLLYYPLTDAYRPVTSGAFSLAEEYSLTAESFQYALKGLNPEGTLVLTRWLQTPPSEGLRAVVTLLEAGDRMGWEGMGDKMVMYRGVQTMTILVRPAGWDRKDIDSVRAFLKSRRFDLVWAPGIEEGDVNLYNQLSAPVYYRKVKALLEAPDREGVVENYPFEISSPSDRHPFFFHYFTWAQTPQVLATLGKTWQPFGGSGYFVLLALLALVVFFSAALIILPLLSSPRLVRDLQQGRAWGILVYFGFLGFGFMMVEIPFIQRWILYLGYPIYAFAAVVGTLLFFSGWGSLAARQNLGWGPVSWAGLILGALTLPLLIGVFGQMVLAWPLWGRLIAVILSLGPLGFLMGMPFPVGLSWIKKHNPGIAPWAWAVNGFTSVIASVIASLLALSYGYDVVLLAGMAAYVGAGFVYGVLSD